MPANYSPTERRRPPHVIVVATDFSEVARLALLQAWQLATQRADAELHVVHVIDDRGRALTKNARLRSRDHLLTVLPGQLRSYAMDLGRQAQLAPLHHPLSVHVRIGKPAREILTLAAELDAAMLVVGSHARGGLDRLVMGSVAHQLVSAGRLPVLVSHPKHFEGISTARSPEAPEPPCPDCLALRRTTGDAQLWCEVHSRAHAQPHTYRWTGNGSSKLPHDSEGAMRGYR